MSSDDNVPEANSEVGADSAEVAPGARPSARQLDGLGFVMDVPVEITVEIGRRSMKIAEVLRLGPGSVLELDKAAGEPLEILVNHKPIARGEAVVVGDHYGIRVTEVLIDEARARGGSSE